MQLFRGLMSRLLRVHLILMFGQISIPSSITIKDKQFIGRSTRIVDSLCTKVVLMVISVGLDGEVISLTTSSSLDKSLG